MDLKKINDLIESINIELNKMSKEDADEFKKEPVFKGLLKRLKISNAVDSIIATSSIDI
jgi:hypothetical protein